MKKRAILITIIGLFLLLLPLLAGAEIADSGKCGENLTWTLDDQGMLTINGNGEMYNYDSIDAPWGSSITSISFGSSVTSIGASAFWYCSSLTNVTIPDNITYIGPAAFRGCNGLNSINITSNVTSIGNLAFSGCSGVQNFKYGDQLVELNGIEVLTFYESNIYLVEKSKTKMIIMGTGDIPDHLQEYYSGWGWANDIVNKITDVTICEGVATIGEYDFEDMIKLVRVTIPNSITSIGTNAFSGCTGLVEITIPNGVEIIENSAFYNCTALTNISIPQSVNHINSTAFQSCTNMTSINVATENNYYSSQDGVLLNKEQTELLIYPRGKEGDYIIPGSVISINGGAFFGCINVTSIIVSNSVVSIGDYAFANCTNLNIIIVPDSVTSIDNNAFYNCSNLKLYGYEGSIAQQYATTNSITFIPIDSESSMVNCGTCGDNLTWTLDDEGLLTINGVGQMDSFSYGAPWDAYCSQIKKVTLEFGISCIGDRAFQNCESFEEIIIPNSVTRIGNDAFAGCVSLANITIPNSVTYIGSDAFWYCSNLSSIIIPNSVINIGDNAFYNCNTLASITIVDNTTHLGRDVFKNCTNVQSFSYNGHTVELNGIGELTFYESIIYLIDKNTTKLTILGEGDLPDEFQEYYSQWGGSNNPFRFITDLIICNGILSVGEYDFAGMSKLERVEIPSSITSIGAYAFNECSNLESIIISNGVKSIENFAFNNCYSLTNIYIPESITNISQTAFQLCSNMTSINVSGENEHYTSQDGVLYNKEQTSLLIYPRGRSGGFIVPNGVTSISGGSFYGCGQITSLTITKDVANIESYAFGGCSNLSTIVIPDSVSNIDEGAFYGCSALTSILFTGSEEQWNSINFGTGNNYLLNVDIIFNYVSPCVHELSIHDKIDATCYETGMEAYWTCDVCEKLFSDAEAQYEIETPIVIPALGHDFVHHDAQAPTCTAIGWDEYDTCSRCDYTTYIEKAALGHSTVIDPAVAPTYTESGLTEGTHCAVCNTVIIPQEEIPPIAIINSGDCGPTMTWILYEDGKLIISGSGYMTSHPWDQGMIKSVEIQEGIRNIVDHAFYRCSNITIVSLPNSLSIIGAYAFQECTGITSISLPDELTIIDDQAFLGCSNLTNILLPESITSIGNSAFCSCSSLVSIIIPDGVSSIGEWCFMASGISDIYANVGSKGAKALGRIGTPFRTNDGPSCYLYQEKNGSYSDLALYSVNDTSITAFEVPSFVTSIYSYAFKDCSNLTQVIIPDSVEEIGSWAFLNCSKLSEITIPDKISRIEEGCFFGSGLETINLPETVTSIGSSAFYNCPMTSIVLPNNIEIIEGYAFNNCNYLDNIIFPESLNHIGSNAFKNCYELKTISVNASLSNIDTDAFTNCFYLTEIKIPACNSYAISWFTDNGYEGALTITPHALSKTERIDATCIAKGIEAFWCCDVCGKLFADEAATTEIEAPLEIPALGHDIVHNEAKEPTCTEAGWEEYETCSRCDYTTYVERVPLGHDWNTAEYKWAENNASLTAIRTCKNDVSHKETETVNVTVVIISPMEDKEGFAAYTSAEFTNEGFNVQTKSVEIPALKDMSVINLPSMLTAIEDEAFENLACEAIIIPNGCTSIGNHAFRNCKNLKYIRVPVNVEIPSSAFEGCENVVIDRTEE